MDNPKKINYLIILISVYITLKILIFTIGDKTLIVSDHYISIGSLFIPLWFFVGDLLTEIYGFNMVKKILIIALICQFFFAFSCFITTLMPGYNNTLDSAYNIIFKLMPRLAFSSLIALVFGALTNSYLLDRWKKIVNGRYFLLRSFSTTIFSEIIFSFIAIYTQFFGKTELIHIVEMLFASITIKFIVSSVIAYPVSIIANYIRFDSEPDNIQYIPPQPQKFVE